MRGQAEELALDHAGEREGGSDSGNDADGDKKQNFTHDQPDDVAASGSESDTNADFARALRNSISHDAVEADDREQGGEEAEDGGEAGNHAVRERELLICTSVVRMAKMGRLESMSRTFERTADIN